MIQVPLGIAYGFPAVLFLVALAVGFGAGRSIERTKRYREERQP